MIGQTRKLLLSVQLSQYLSFFHFIVVAWAKVPSERVGCENNPCQHQCVDTVDSYYCLCFENFILQPDRHSCLREYTEGFVL